MPRTKQDAVTKAATVDQPERFRLGEIGSTGLNIFSGITQEELKSDLNFPNCISTYKLMTYSPAINAPLSLKKAMLSKVKWKIVPPKDATEEEKNKADIINQMLFQDMEKSFEDFIEDVFSTQEYGFSVFEKVFRRRTKSAGSIFDDGLIGIRKLAHRHQQSIQKFIFSDDGNDVIGVKQVITNTNDPLGRYIKRGTEVVIPRSKFMLFTVGTNSDNPFGVSPLRNAYLPWKYLSAIEELEAVGVQKELHGIPVFRIPAQYMSADAPPEQKAAFEAMKNIGRNLQAGNQSCIFLPSNIDMDGRNPLFDIELLSTDGKRSFDIDAIKRYYKELIFISLGADVLLLGSSSTGSYALGSLKNTLVGNDVEAFVKRIKRVINDDLIASIYELNSWSMDRMCQIDFDGVEDTDLETLSKAFQRLGATGYLPKTPEVINRALDSLGIDTLPEGITQEELDEMLPDKTTKSGQGMEQGLPGGTGNADGSSGNASDVNSDNAA